jgi:hypothetical protein
MMQPVLVVICDLKLISGVNCRSNVISPAKGGIVSLVPKSRTNQGRTRVSANVTFYARDNPPAEVPFRPDINASKGKEQQTYCEDLPH